MTDRKVRVFLGTRKGSYVLESDLRRRRFKVHGPYHDGDDVFHVTADPRHPGTVYAAVNNGWWGPMLFRSRNWGAKWSEISVPQTPRRSKRTAPVEAPNPKYPIKNIWHIEPGRPADPKTIYLGADPGSLWRSDDEGSTWEPVAGLNDHPSRPKWGPGAGGLCLHTILLDPDRPERMYAGISAAGFLRSDDGGATWKHKNKNVLTPFLPGPTPEFGQCVHKVAMDPANPSLLYRQDHGGIYVSRDAGDSWDHMGKVLGDDFGFAVASAPASPGSAFFVPLASETRAMSGHGFHLSRWSESSRKFSQLRAPGVNGEFGMHREGLATDALDPTGVYVGASTGQLFYSADAGRRWAVVPYQFPGIHSVSTSSPAA
jgi:photosystem II stability/assembly factor-like uncharacterized protein